MTLTDKALQRAYMDALEHTEPLTANNLADSFAWRAGDLHGAAKVYYAIMNGEAIDFG